jgi:hypothetical protein
MRIEQAHISPVSHQHFRDEFLERWNLREYDNPEEPAVFYGLYPDWDGETQSEKDTSYDIEIYNDHNGVKVLLCGGVEYTRGIFNKIDKENLNLIVVDDWEVESCKTLKLPYKHLKVPYFDFDRYLPTKLGDKIYSHIPLREISRQYHENGQLVTKFEEIFQYEKLMKLFGEDMFCFPKEWTDTSKMLPYFNQSFVNIKPHKVRGYVTSWKLGCMGRNTITVNTEGAPNFLHYKSDDDLLRLVDEESKKIGTIQENKLLEYFHQSDDWLYEDYWK